MELFSGINWWAVLVAVLAFQALGAAWYSILANPWMASIGLTKEQVQAGDPLPYVVAVIGGILFNTALAVLLARLGIATWAGAIGLSVVLMLCINVGQLAKHYAFAGSVFKQRWMALFYDGTGDLVAAAVGGLILGIWR